MSDTLKSLLDQQQILNEKLLEAYGEIDDEMSDALATVELKLPEKVDRYCGLLDRLDTDAERFKEKADKYLIAAKQITRLKEKLLSNVRNQMVANKLTELVGIDEKFRLSGKTGKLVVEEGAAVPRSYFHSEVIQKLDSAKLKSDVQAGTIIPGVSIQPTLSRSINKGK